MSASEYWGPLERLLSERTAVLRPEVDIPDMLVRAGMIAPDNRDQAAELLSEHQDGWAESEYDAYCKCGKWLEIGYYELENHQANVLDDAGLIIDDTA
jgi:hypothetical protein